MPTIFSVGNYSSRSLQSSKYEIVALHDCSFVCLCDGTTAAARAGGYEGAARDGRIRSDHRRGIEADRPHGAERRDARVVADFSLIGLYGATWNTQALD